MRTMPPIRGQERMKTIDLAVLQEQGIDPHEVIVPGNFMENYGPPKSGEVFTVWIVDDTVLEGKRGECELRFQQVPVFNAIAANRAHHVGKSALLESVASSASEVTSFPRVMKGIMDKLHAITGANQKISPMVEMRGSARGATYRMSPNLRFKDVRDEAISRLIEQATKKSVHFEGREITIASFPNKAMRERVLTELLRDHSQRPLVATSVAELLSGRMRPVTENYGTRLISYPELTTESEALLLLDIEKGLLAYTGLDDDSDGNAAAIESCVVVYNQLVFHCQYIAYAAAKRFAHRLPFENLYQEANLAVMRVVKRHELVRDEGETGDLNGHVVTAVDRQIRKVIAEESEVIRLPHSAVEAIRELSDEEARFMLRHRREPTAEEIAPLVSSSEQRVLELYLLREMAFGSFDEPAYPDSDTSVGETIQDRSALLFDRWVDQWRARDVLETVMDKSPLTDHEKVVISVRYGVHFPSLAGIEFEDFLYPYNAKFFPFPRKDIHSQAEAGQILGMNSSAVSATERRAFSKACEFLATYFGVSSYEHL